MLTELTLLKIAPALLYSCYGVYLLCRLIKPGAQRPALPGRVWFVAVVLAPAAVGYFIGQLNAEQLQATLGVFYPVLYLAAVNVFLALPAALFDLALTLKFHVALGHCLLEIRKMCGEIQARGKDPARDEKFEKDQLERKNQRHCEEEIRLRNYAVIIEGELCRNA